MKIDNVVSAGVLFGGATVQFGESSDSYVDWRVRIGFDLTEDNLLYLLVATGNKAPSFNDTIDLDTGPAEVLFTPPVGPEKNTMFEIGSKNTIDVGYTHGEGAVRFAAFANNVTDEAHPTQATIDTGTQEFVFNPPRTYGVRMRVEF